MYLLLIPLALVARADFATTITGLASLDDMRAGTNLVAFAVPEDQQGVDLNGDGDQIDDVLHVHMVDSGVTRNIGLAVSPVSFELFLVRGTRVAFEVSEMDQGGTDLDGDGSIFDRVLFVYDAATDSVHNLGVPGQFYSNSLADPEWIPVAVGEALTNTDFNGDGDVNDQVLFVYRMSTGVLQGTATAIEFVVTPAIRNGRMAYAASEHDSGADLTGDGDQNDFCLFTRDLISEVDTNWQIPARDLQLGAERLAFLVHEPMAGMDLGGDGERFDYVPHVLDFQSATITNTGLAYRRFQGIQFDGRYLLTPVNELREATDFNGDGDIFLFDDVLHLTDTQTGTTTNLGISTDIIFGSRRDKRRVAYAVSEEYEGGLDANGDGDASDNLLASFDFQSTLLTPSSMELSFGFQLAGPFVASATAEGGKDDFNGNGSTFDKVLFLHNLATGTTLNTRVAVRDMQIVGRLAVYRRVPVLDAVDLGGSPTPAEDVAWIDLTDGTSGRTNLTATSRGYTAGDSFFAYATPERLFGAGTDLNGDGDLGDRVLVIRRRQ